MALALRSSLQGAMNIVRGKSLTDKQVRAAYLFILPAVVFFGLHFILPVLYDLYLTLFRFSFVEAPTFAGLQFYQAIARDSLFWSSLWRTFYLAVLSVPATMAIAMVLAVVLDGIGSPILKNVLRTVYFLPVVTSGVAIAFVWTWLFQPSPQFGLFNVILSRLGLPAHMWLTSVSEVMPSIAIMNLWARVGFDTIIFMAGIQGIPETYYEAARLEGANRIRLFFHITLPLLNPQVVLVSIFEIINVLKSFDIPYVATDGGPINASRVIMLHIYDKAFKSNAINEATVGALFLFGLILIVTLLQWRLLNRPVEY
ncbi:MAG: sugar ABC transporter permease [Chloroflexi bacterium]|nr:sugar ABC transporter permease [Chloroflexota bacterium]